MKIEIEDIKRLRVEPGDHLLVHLPSMTTMEEAQLVSEMFKRHWPDVPTIIVRGERVELEVVSA